MAVKVDKKEDLAIGMWYYFDGLDTSGVEDIDCIENDGILDNVWKNIASGISVSLHKTEAAAVKSIRRGLEIERDELEMRMKDCDKRLRKIKGER